MPRPSRGLLTAVGLLAPAALLALPSAASAAAPSCPTAPERLKVTWGAAGPAASTRTTAGRWPRLEQEHAPGALASATVVLRRTGLALGADPEVRTVRDRRKVGTPVVCVDGRVRARLPRITRRQVVGAASVQGSWVAWRVAARGEVGRVHRARVVGGRLRDHATVPTAPGVPHELVNGNVVVGPTGTVAWTLGVGPEDRNARSSATVWPAGRRVAVALPAPAPATRPEEAGTTVPRGVAIALVGNRHVQLDEPGAEPVAFASDEAERCPDPIVPAIELAGWRLAVAASIVLGPLDPGATWTALATVCDPQTGRLLSSDRVVAHRVSRWGPAYSMDGVVRLGPWLLATTSGSDPFGLGPYRFVLRNVDDGRRITGEGAVRGPGAWTAEELEAERGRLRPTPTGAVTAPGVLAVVDGKELLVLDADGERRIALGEQARHFALVGDELRWEEAGGPRQATVRPRADAPYAFVDPRISAYSGSD